MKKCKITVLKRMFNEELKKQYIKFDDIDVNSNKLGATVTKRNDKLNDIVIPAPSEEEQERIVNILDRFDKLCNDISEGLPAEIEARQKQYKYYRDKLLNFKELKK